MVSRRTTAEFCENAWGLSRRVVPARRARGHPRVTFAAPRVTFVATRVTFVTLYCFSYSDPLFHVATTQAKIRAILLDHGDRWIRFT
jgi:hypothetical protein